MEKQISKIYNEIEKFRASYLNLSPSEVYLDYQKIYYYENICEATILILDGTYEIDKNVLQWISQHKNFISFIYYELLGYINDGFDINNYDNLIYLINDIYQKELNERNK